LHFVSLVFFFLIVSILVSTFSGKSFIVGLFKIYPTAHKALMITATPTSDTRST